MRILARWICFCYTSKYLEIRKLLRSFFCSLCPAKINVFFKTSLDFSSAPYLQFFRSKWKRGCGVRSARGSRAVSGVLGNFKKRTGKIHRGKGEAVRKQNRIRFAASADTRLKYADTGRCAWSSFCPCGRRCWRVTVLCSRCSSKGAVGAKMCFFRIPHRVQSCSVVSEEQICLSRRLQLKCLKVRLIYLKSWLSIEKTLAGASADKCQLLNDLLPCSQRALNRAGRK